MVRNHVVNHPSEWFHCGYHEIQNPRRRYSLIDRKRLTTLCGLEKEELLREKHRELVDEAVHKGEKSRQPEWTESITAGSEQFIVNIKKKLEFKVSDRTVHEINGHYELREAENSYTTHFHTKTNYLSMNNAYNIDLSDLY